MCLRRRNTPLQWVLTQLRAAMNIMLQTYAEKDGASTQQNIGSKGSPNLRNQLGTSEEKTLTTTCIELSRRDRKLLSRRRMLDAIRRRLGVNISWNRIKLLRKGNRPQKGTVRNPKITPTIKISKSWFTPEKRRDGKKIRRPSVKMTYERFSPHPENSDLCLAPR